PRGVHRALLVVVLVACGSDADRPRGTPSPEPRPAADAQPRPSPDTQPRPAYLEAIGSTSQLSPELQRAFDPAGPLPPMAKPGPGDWLAEHPETPQSYDDYIASSPNLPNGQRRVIYLLPIGDFPPGTPSLASLADIVKAFFTLDVRQLPAVRISDVRAQSR